MSNSGPARLHLYGLKNCDSCRKAQAWLKARQAPFTFHDIRDEHLSESLLKGWLVSDHGSKLLNRRSTTWKNLGEAEKQSADDDPLTLLLANPTLIKRPVVTDGKRVLDVGFSPSELEKFA